MVDLLQTIAEQKISEVIKNAGYSPEEMEIEKRISIMKELIEKSDNTSSYNDIEGILCKKIKGNVRLV